MNFIRSTIVLLAVLAASPAYAQAAGQSAAGGIASPLLLVGAMFVIFYFFLIRPQQKRQKQHQEMVNSVRRGDTVVTSGGLIGRVTKVIDENEIQVELAENVRVRIVKGTLADVRGKGEPAPAGKNDKKAKGDKPEKEAANDEPANDKTPTSE
jgi:preprotein translocase subunit YajC